MQVSVLSSLDSDRAADIVEEMDPDAAADVLGDMPPEASQEILTEMQPEERAEVTELMTFEEDTAAGRMTTEYMALKSGAKVSDAIEMLRNFEGGVESMSTIYIIGEREKLLGQVPLAKMVLATPETPLMLLSSGHMPTIHPGADEKEVAELFDKYNLLTLPVIDDEGVLTGVITADDVINMLQGEAVGAVECTLAAAIIERPFTARLKPCPCKANLRSSGALLHWRISGRAVILDRSSPSHLKLRCHV